MIQKKLRNGLKGTMLGILLLSSMVVGAQDVGFSQFYANPLYLNPAFAGSAVAPRVAMSFRAQWPSLVSAFSTVSASYDQYVNDLHGGIGVIVMADRQGDHGAITTSSLGGMYSFRFQLGRDIYVSAALQASLVNNHLRWDYLLFPGQIDPTLGGIIEDADPSLQPEKFSRWSADFNTGVLVSGSKWYAGIAVSHLTQPVQSFYSDDDHVPIKLTVHGGGLINVAEESRRQSSLGLGAPIVNPNIVYQYSGGYHYFNYGVNLDWQPFTVGMWLRHGIENIDAFIFTAGVQFDYFKVGYSYDVTVSKLSNVTGGAHELSIGVLMPVPENKKKVKAIRCPSF